MIENVFGTVTERTMFLYRKSWAKYQDHCQENELAETSAAAVMSWRKSLVEQGFSPNTINSHLSAIKTVFKEALPSGEISLETYAQVKAIGSVSVRALRDRLRPAKDLLTDESVMRILNAIDVTTLKGIRDRAIIATLATTGVRIEELSELNTSYYRPDDNLIYVKGKTDIRPRAVPLSNIAKQAIALWLYARGVDSWWIFNGFEGRSGVVRTDFSITTQGAYDVITSRAAAVGVDVAPHDFRRYVATRLAQDNIVNAQAVLGHKSIITTQRYVKQADLPSVDWLG
jgi:site-specific recombinase XerD